MTVYDNNNKATTNANPFFNCKIIEKPFDWNDNLSEIAQEDFSMIQQSLSYGTCQTIGMALAKLELLEKQGCKVEPQESEGKE